MFSVIPTAQEKAWERKIAKIEVEGTTRRVVAVANIPKNTFVAVYPGAVTKDASGTYVWDYYRVVDNHIDPRTLRIDAAEGEGRSKLLKGRFRDCIAPFVNEPAENQTPNLRPVLNLLRKPAALEYYTMRDIVQGEELTICYGGEYDRKLGGNRHVYRTGCKKNGTPPKFLWGTQPSQLRSRPGPHEAIVPRTHRAPIIDNPAMGIDRRMDESVLSKMQSRKRSRSISENSHAEREPHRRRHGNREDEASSASRELLRRQVENLTRNRNSWKAQYEDVVRRYGNQGDYEAVLASRELLRRQIANLGRERNSWKAQYEDVERRYGKISRENYEAALARHDEAFKTRLQMRAELERKTKFYDRRMKQRDRDVEKLREELKKAETPSVNVVSKAQYDELDKLLDLLWDDVTECEDKLQSLQKKYDELSKMTRSPP